MKQMNSLQKTAYRVSMVSIIGNILLAGFKLLAGLLAHSGAMVSDAVHSASDVISSIVVIIGVKLAAKESDQDHPYGHERMECVAAIVLSGILLATGAGIGLQAVKQVMSRNMETLQIPGLLAGIAAVLSIVVKEMMFHYTKWNAKKINSSALLADAWHHRSDALSSIGAMIGIFGARMGFPILDPIASLIICIFIAKASVEIFQDAINKMVDHSCDKETEQAIYETALQQEGVIRIDMLHTRMFGNKIYADLEIGADAYKSLEEAHEIARRVHQSIEQEFPMVKHIMVHINPVKGSEE